MLQFISHRDDECTQFFDDYLVEGRKVLFIGTLGFNDLCLHFPSVLSKRPNIDYVFLVEERTEVSQILRDTAKRNKDFLDEALKGRHVRFLPIQVVADDTAIVAGRSAAKVGRSVLGEGHTDVLIDATSMSRPPCAKRCASVDETLVDPDHLASGLLLGRNNNFRPGQYVIPLKPSIGPRGVP